MKKMIETMLNAAAVVSAVALFAVSCGPEDPIDEGNGDGQGNGPTEEQLAYADSVENALYKQARAMQVVLTPSEEPVLVSSCVAGETENMYTITLSSGASFPIVIDKDEMYADALSYIESEGKKYWAICDKDGNMVPVEDADGIGVELSASLDIKVVDKKCCLELAGTAYDMGYDYEDKVQIFDCALLEDNAGDIYAVMFDFGADKTKIVYVADYSGFYFYLPSDESKTPVSEMYINMAGKATLATTILEDVAWTSVASENVSVSIREVEGVSYVDLDITERGDFTGEQKLQAVSEDGSCVFAEIALTSKQFRSLSVSMTDAIITPTTGVGKFAYGLSLYTDFDEQELLTLAAGLIEGTAQPSAGNGVSEGAVLQSFEAILGAPLDAEARYILWAVADGVLSQIEVSDIDVAIEVESVGLLDADVNVAVSGVKAIFGGVMQLSDDMVSNILYQVNNLVYDPMAIGDDFEYVGAASDFPVVDDNKVSLLPHTSYALWVVPVVDGEYEYTEKDVIFREFETNPIVSGGSLELICSEPTATPSTLSFDLSCEGASMIYYAFLTSNGGSRYAGADVPDKVKFEQIILEDSDVRKGDYQAVIGNKVTAVSPKLNDEAATEYWLYAVAVDADGKHGKVLCKSAKTLALAYDNTISLTVETVEVTATKAEIKVTSNGGDLSDYIYWMGRSSDPFYRNPAYCGGYKAGAQKYMAMNPDDENIVACMRKYGRLADDGTILFDGLTMETTYVMVILEKGDEYYSPIGYKLFNTLAADLGTIVREGTEKWNSVKNTIGLDWHREKFNQVPHLGAYFSFDFTCPKEYTAYIMCAGAGYYEELNFTKIEHFMIEIENYTSRRIDKDHVPYGEDGNYLQEPDYYKDGVLTEGQLMSVNDFYAHGASLFGAVTYFAENSHKEGNCISWENGGCTNYKRAEEMIAYYNTIEPYEKRAEAFGLEGKEAEDWALALKEAYAFYYENAKPLIYINDGSPLYVVNASATGVNEDGVVPDRVYVMLKDLQGNYFEPMCFEVPNYFEQK